MSEEHPDQLNFLAEEFKSDWTSRSKFIIKISACYIWTQLSSKIGNKWENGREEDLEILQPLFTFFL